MSAPPGVSSPAQLLRLLQDQGEVAAAQDVLHPTHSASPHSVELFPEPGFVIKTADGQGGKVFINVCACTSPALRLPAGWEAAAAGGELPAAVRRFLEHPPDEGAAPVGDTAGAAELLRLPLSVGAPRQGADREGLPCTEVDVVLGSEALQLAAEHRPLKHFVVQLVLGSVEHKHAWALDPQYRLPRMRYKGQLPPPAQRVRTEDKGPGATAALVQELPAAAAVAGAGAAPAPPLAQLKCAAEFLGRPAELVRLTVRLPAALPAPAAADVGVRLAECGDLVRVEVPGCAVLEARLPMAAAPDGRRAAQLDTRARTLVVELRLRSFGELLGDAIEAARAAEAAARA